MTAIMEWITLEDHLNKRLGPKGTPERDAYDHEVETEIEACVAREDTTLSKARPTMPPVRHDERHYAASATTA